MAGRQALRRGCHPPAGCQRFCVADQHLWESDLDHAYLPPQLARSCQHRCPTHSSAYSNDVRLGVWQNSIADGKFIVDSTQWLGGKKDAV